VETIFINYRRQTNAAAAGRLFDQLALHFDRSQLFMDVDGIELGVDFVKTLQEQVARCSVFLVVIGQGWADIRNADGKRRLDDPDDYVRLEVQAALRRDIRIVPILVDDASMPRPNELPAEIRDLSRRHAFELAHHRFAADVAELARSLEEDIEASKPLVVLPAHADDPEGAGAASWHQVLFSLKGRISRQPYWLGMAGISVVYMATFAVFLAVIGDAAYDRSTTPPHASRQMVAFSMITLVPLAWCNLALLVKRAHDLDQGSVVGWLIAVLGFWWVGSDYIPGGGYVAYASMLAATGMTIALGFVKGTSGPNRFGPDPLARKRKRRKAAG
jgi:uncharacterized membrane protein YhaH (DUF805 family)